MTVAIFPESSESTPLRFRAVSGDQNAVGMTAGEALDALNAQIGASSCGPLLILPGQQPDRFFGESQISRLRELMDRWRVMRDRGESMASNEQTELNSLVEAELNAAANRAEAISNALAR